MSLVKHILSWIFIKLILVYQWTLSPLLGKSCRFFPSCSHYALFAIKRHGPFKGALLTIKRLSKCGPWHSGGIDLVPGSNLDDFLQ